MEGQTLICFSGTSGSQYAALVQIGHRKMRLQIRTRTGFERSQIHTTAWTAVKIEKRRAVPQHAFDADMEANAVDGRYIMGFRKTHAASMIWTSSFPAAKASSRYSGCLSTSP